MVGELYKTSMGWAVRFPASDIKETQEFGITIIPIENSDELMDKYIGKVVNFSVIIKSTKINSGRMPYAKISLN